MGGMTDKNVKPGRAEMGAYIASPLFDALYDYMLREYAALVSFDYSGEKTLLGWNVRFYKAGRTLIRLYPKQGFVTVLVVVGRREKDRAEALMPEMSEVMRTIYAATPEGMGQKWLMIDLKAEDDLYRDVLKLVALRAAR